MRKHIGVAVAGLVTCALLLGACDLKARPDGLPRPPGDAECPASGNQVTDNGPNGPPCRDVKEFKLHEVGRYTKVDLEHFPAGRSDDLSYDHFTGELKPINGAKVLLYKEDNGLGWLGRWFTNEPTNRGAYPGEQECRQRRAEGRDAFSKGDLEASFSIFCITTAENRDGFILVKPIPNQKPAAYDVYSYIWVR